MLSLPARLAALRTLAGLKPTELGMLAGLSHYTVSTIETGKSSPQLDTLTKLAGVLGDSAGWLLTGSGSPPSKDTIDESVAAARKAAAEKPADGEPERAEPTRPRNITPPVAG